MPSSLAGVLFVLAFSISQAIRDAFFGNVFQSVSFFFVAVLAFGASTLGSKAKVFPLPHRRHRRGASAFRALAEAKQGAAAA